MQSGWVSFDFIVFLAYQPLSAIEAFFFFFFRPNETDFLLQFVDCQFSLHASVPPMMSLDDLDPSLPCADTIWDLNAAALSRQLNSLHSNVSPAVLFALQVC
jgi:hypothetical protein